MSYRDIDMTNEQMLAKYLDEHFYSTGKFEKFERVTDKYQQLLGKDIIVTSSKLNLTNTIIDEKNTSHYVNKDIPTFAFELSTLTKNGTLVEGWLTDPRKQTEYYLLAYPFANLINPYDKVPTFKEITKVKLLLIKRDAILKFLESSGYNRESLINVSKIIREHVKSQEDNKEIKERMKSNKGFWFNETLHLSEKPINVIIPRNKLEELAILKSEV